MSPGRSGSRCAMEGHKHSRREHGVGNKPLANDMASSKNNTQVTPRAFRRPCAEGQGGSGLDGVPPAWVTCLALTSLSLHSTHLGVCAPEQSWGQAGVEDGCLQSRVTDRLPVPLSPGSDSKRAPWQGKQPWRVWEVGWRCWADAVTEVEGTCSPQQLSLPTIPLTYS